jgi:hydroxyethylthiazole kinase-like uncharacterized protein yjeF
MASNLVSQDTALDSAEMAILDRNSEYLGVSTIQLMENAGRSVADEVEARFGKGASVTIYGGTGRNGGDGMVAARHLASRGFKVLFRLIGNERSIRDDSVLSNWSALKSMETSVKIQSNHDSSTIPTSDSDILIDAMLGTGVHGKLRQPYLRGVQVLNSSAGFKIAVDVPTGIDSDTGELLGEAVRANLTVTLHAPKKGFSSSKQYCGEVKVAHIGIPPEAALYAGPGDVAAVSRERPAAAHKGQYGRLLVIGGSEIFSGAPTLVALAAYRTGVDLVNVAAPEKAAQSIASFSPSIITIKLPGSNLTVSHLRILNEHIQQANAVALGPGLGLAKESVSASRKIVNHLISEKKPILIDADALKALGVVKRRIFDETVVMTPHAGEFEAVSGKSPSRELKTRISEVRGFASISGAVTVLKGYIDVISDGSRVKLNSTGNPGMTVGGTGDVLSGIIAGLMAQGFEPYKAAVAGTFVNGAAGDMATERYGYHLTPSDLIEHIPRILSDPMSHKAILDKRKTSIV